MLTCEVCGFGAKSKSGLASHRRARHVEVPDVPVASVAASVARDLAGVAGPAGVRAAALALARAIDESSSSRDLAALSRELRLTLAELGVGADEKVSSGLDDLAAKRAARRAASSGAASSA